MALPPPGALPASSLDNWKLDKLVGQLGKDRATWRRAMLLYEWLKASQHAMDDRLCTTVGAATAPLLCCCSCCCAHVPDRQRVVARTVKQMAACVCPQQ